MHLFLTTTLSSPFRIRTYVVNASSQRLSLSVLTQRVYHDKFLSPYRAGGDSPRCDGLALTSTLLLPFANDARPLLGPGHAFPETPALNVYLFTLDVNGHLRP